jgi:hypothetical protein
VLLSQLGGLDDGQLGGKAIDGIEVVVNFLIGRDPHSLERSVVASLQVLAVLPDMGAVGVDFFAFAWLGRRIPGDFSFIGNDRVVQHDDHIDVRGELDVGSRMFDGVGHGRAGLLGEGRDRQRQDHKQGKQRRCSLHCEACLPAHAVGKRTSWIAG